MHAFLFAAFATAANAATVTPASNVNPDFNVAWLNGAIAGVGSNTACLSNPPIPQVRTSGYAGFSFLPPSSAPAVGEVFYTHLVLSHPGNPCGGSVVGLELLLPQGLEAAISEHDPVFCLGINPSNVLFNYANDNAYGCPQTLAQGLEGLRVAAPRGGAGGGGWLMRQGSWIEIFVPVRSTIVQFGDRKIRWRINPAIAVVGYAEVPVFADDDVIFRNSQDGMVLPVELCTGQNRPQGC